MKKITELSIVVGGGALGGLISVMEAWGDPSSYPLSLAKVFALFVIPFVKGGAAAGIGVYFLSSFDTKHWIRALFFAVACGLTFPSILTKSGSMVDSVTSQVASQSLYENEKIIKDVMANGETISGNDVAIIKEASEKIIIAGSKVQDPENTNVNFALNDAIATLGKKAMEGDEMAVKAISDIGLLSYENNLHRPTRSVMRELGMITESPDINRDIRQQAMHSIEVL